MSRVKFSKNLKEEYERLYKECKIKTNKFTAVDRLVDLLISYKDKYLSVAEKVGVPWYFIAVIHNMESSQNFHKHLHNGDPLTAKTVHIPAGRPKKGNPPFTWEESAIDALKLQRLDKIEEWSLGRLLYEIEKYNGWGYRLHHPHVLSPYLWSWSTYYKSGKYVADGRWSDSAVSRQCGAVVLLRRMDERGDINLSKEYVSDTQELQYPIFRYDKSSYNLYIENLQIFMNKFEDTVLRVDGKGGPKTSNAFKKLFGYYLYGDPRIFEEDSENGVL